MPDFGETIVDDAPQGLAEAQLAAIEDAFGQHERQLRRLRRELEALSERPAVPGGDAADTGLAARLDAMEMRLDQQDAALRHVLDRLITVFER